MKTVCANCGNTQGPFYSVFNGGPRACKNTKENPNRLEECVARRQKLNTREGHNLRVSGGELSSNDFSAS